MGSLKIIFFGVAISMGVQATEVTPPSIDKAQFEADLNIIMPLVSSLKGECIAENQSEKCRQSEAIMRILRNYVELKSGAGEMSKGVFNTVAHKYMETFMAGMEDALSAAAVDARLGK